MSSPSVLQLVLWVMYPTICMQNNAMPNDVNNHDQGTEFKISYTYL